MLSRLARTALATAGAAAVLAIVIPAPAYAYNFPFNGRCGAQWYWDGPSQTMATFSHVDGGTYWYRITWGGQPPVPGDPLHHHNWSGCRK